MASRWARFDIRQVGRVVLIVLGSWLLVNLLVLGLVVRPRMQEFRTLERESQPRLNALAQRKKEVESLEGFLGGLHQAEQDLADLRGRRLGTRARQMVPVQLELSRLAEQFNINLDQVRYENSELEDEALERFAMVVPLEAGYGNLRRFIQAVESSERFLVIERVALGQTREGGVLLQLNITLATYFDAPHLKRESTRDPAERRRERQQRPGPRPVERRA